MCGLFVFLVLEPLNSFPARMSVDYFNANVYSAAGGSQRSAVRRVVIWNAAMFTGSLFWSVCAVGLLIAVPG